MKKPKVLITHSWSYNAGDVAILISSLKAIKKAAPLSDITVLVSHPKFTRKTIYEAQPRIEGWIWPIPDIEKEHPGLSTMFKNSLVLAGNLGSVISYRLFRKKLFVFNKEFKISLERLFESDVLISPGGDFLGPDYFFLTILMELSFAKILGKKTIIYAQTIGPFRNPIHRFIVSAVLKSVDLIIVREEITARMLEGMGVKGFHIGADMVFATEFLKNAPAVRKHTIVISGKRPNWRLRRSKIEYMKNMGKLASRIIREFGGEVVLLPTDFYDIAFQKEMLRFMPAGVTQIEEVYMPERIAATLAGSRFLISSRMHAIILGCHSSTPFYAIGDSNKFIGVLDRICENRYTRFDELDEKGIERIMEAIRQENKIRLKIENEFPEISRRAKLNFSILKSKFVEWGYGKDDLSL